MSNWTTAEDVATLWAGDNVPLLPNPKIDKYILLAEAIILNEFPDTQANIDDGTVQLILVQSAVAAMVIRAYQKSLDGRINYSETSGPFSQSGTYASAQTALNLMEITDGERRWLTPSEKTQRIRPVRLYGDVNPYGTVDVGDWDGAL